MVLAFILTALLAFSLTIWIIHEIVKERKDGYSWTSGYMLLLLFGLVGSFILDLLVLNMVLC